jgi:hypothetical protein
VQGYAVRLRRSRRAVTGTTPKEYIVSQASRLVLALVIVLVDWAVFFFPLAALFIAYVITTNPPWVRDFLNRLDPGASS